MIQYLSWRNSYSFFILPVLIHNKSNLVLILIYKVAKNIFIYILDQYFHKLLIVCKTTLDEQLD